MLRIFCDFCDFCEFVEKNKQEGKKVQGMFCVVYEFVADCEC